jgi:hypothetical protein
MPRTRHISCWCLLTGLTALAGPALADWHTLFFDGRELREGSQGRRPALRYRDGDLPFVDYSSGRPQEARLPAGTGGLAGLCFIQVAGGKAHRSPGYLPLAGEPIEIRGRDIALAVRSDASGHFVVALPPGSYDLIVRGLKQRVLVERGKNVFLPIRGGKRMVD